jgi:NAD(P)-dependent dehydrogenase (short-subunit alcohol dehydrogenase family)
VAVVTGAASGIGAAIARALLAEGAAVIGGDLDTAGLERLAGETRRNEAGSRVSAFCGLPLDVTDEVSVAAFFDEVQRRYGRLDHAFNVAGASRGGGITELDRASWDFTVDLVLGGVFLCTKYEGRMMAAGGSIVQVSSVNARIPMFGGSAYSAAKAGVESFAASAAVEFAPRGIRVNSILPGLVETPLTEGFRSIPALAEKLKARIPLDRIATPEEIAAPALFLAAPEAAYITGASLLVDGGWNVSNYPDVREYL